MPTINIPNMEHSHLWRDKYLLLNGNHQQHSLSHTHTEEEWDQIMIILRKNNKLDRTTGQKIDQYIQHFGQSAPAHTHSHRH